MNLGRFSPITCSPRVVSPRKVSRFAPLNRYYIIINEVFFDNFLVIIYLLVVCKKKKKNHSFWSTLIIYLLVVYKKKKFIHFGQWNIVEHKRENIFLKKESHLCVQNGNKIRRNRLTETSNSPS